MATEPKSAASTTSAILVQVMSHDITCLTFSLKETKCTTELTKRNLNSPTNRRKTLAMREEGLEPSSLYRQRILSPLCLPISSFSQIHSMKGTTFTYYQVLQTNSNCISLKFTWLPYYGSNQLFKVYGFK